MLLQRFSISRISALALAKNNFLFSGAESKQPDVNCFVLGRVLL